MWKVKLLIILVGFLVARIAQMFATIWPPFVASILSVSVIIRPYYASKRNSVLVQWIRLIYPSLQLFSRVFRHFSRRMASRIALIAKKRISASVGEQMIYLSMRKRVCSFRSLARFSNIINLLKEVQTETLADNFPGVVRSPCCAHELWTRHAHSFLYWASWLQAWH